MTTRSRIRKPFDRRFRPGLEALEKRLVPATYTVNSFADPSEAGKTTLRDALLAANANNPGYDLVAKDGRQVQVRALRHSQPHHERGLMGPMRDPYDTLFAVKLSSEFEPLRGQGAARRA